MNTIEYNRKPLTTIKIPRPPETRLWRVSATLPYPDFIFTTRTLPRKVLKILEFRVVTIQYTCCFHTGLHQWCQLLSSGGKGFFKDGKIYHIPPYTGFRNMQVTICQKYRSNTTTSCTYDFNFEVLLSCSEWGHFIPFVLLTQTRYCRNLHIFWVLFCSKKISHIKVLTKYDELATICATRYPTRYPDFFTLPYPNPTRHSLLIWELKNEK